MRQRMNEYMTDFFILLVDFRELLFSFQYIYYRNSFLTVTVHSSFFPTFDFFKNMLLSALDSIC